MAEAVAYTQVNGHAPPGIADPNAQAAFYQQLLQLRDAVLSDRHPRFKLPATVKQKLQSGNTITTSSAFESSQALPGLLTNGFDARGQESFNTASQSDEYSLQQKQNAQAFADNQAAHASQAPGMKTAPSNIFDPVLLTKSDDLIRAETQLKRQRIEKKLKEQAEQRKHVSEPHALMNMPEILHKAWELVKPISGLKPLANAPTAASDSFDENSYYSSQVNDWSSEASADSRREDAAPVKSSVPDVATTMATGPASNTPLFQQYQSQGERGQVKQAPLPRATEIAPLEEDTSLYANDTEGAYDAEREDSEEYSPPAAEAFSGADGDAMDLDDDGVSVSFGDEGMASDITTDSSEFVPEEPTIPSPQVPVIKNHLNHIVAPQPSRVSPLTTTKVSGSRQRGAYGPLVNQIHEPITPGSDPLYAAAAPRNGMVASEESTTSPRNSGHQSPVVPLAKKQRHKKKWRREADAAEARGKARKKREREQNATAAATAATTAIGTVGPTATAATAAVAASPEPYIKAEPVSPPPLGMVPEQGSAHGRRPAQQQLPPDVEIVQPYDFRPRPRQTYHQEPPPPQPQAVQYGSPASPVLPSPGSYRRSRRDDQDLRRVASLHAAHKPASPIYPTHSPVYSPGDPYRTGPQAYPETAAAPQIRYRVDTGRAPSQYIRSERSLSPQQVREGRDGYVQRIQSPALMPAPPPPQALRRIIVDQYGNKYMAAEEAAPVQIPAPRMSVAPQAPPSADGLYERAPSRASAVYAPRSAQGIYGEDSASMMPPPPIRRIAVQAETQDYRMYRQRDYSRPPEAQYYREEPVYRDYPAMPPPAPAHRASVYPAEPVAQAGHTRAYSVRPEAEAIRYMSRAPSVMPQAEYMRVADDGGAPSGLRAVSVAPGAEYGRAPGPQYSYAPPGSYPMAPPNGRYTEEDGLRMAPRPRTEVYMDEYGREIRRVVPGYQ